MSQFKVGDWVWLGKPYFDCPAGELVEIYTMGTDEDASAAFRPVLRHSKYSKTGYWFAPNDNYYNMTLAYRRPTDAV